MVSSRSSASHNNGLASRSFLENARAGRHVHQVRVPLGEARGGSLAFPADRVDRIVIGSDGVLHRARRVDQYASCTKR